MINLRVLRVLLSYHLNVLGSKVEDVYPVIEEIANLGLSENQDLANDVLSLIN